MILNVPIFGTYKDNKTFCFVRAQSFAQSFAPILGTLIFGNASRLLCRCTFVSSANSISYSVPDDNELQ